MVVGGQEKSKEVAGFLNTVEGKGWDLHWLRNERWGWVWSKAIYEFSLIYPDALTWQDESGYWRPDQHEAETDLGSIPPPLRGMLPHDQFIIPFSFHDSAWRKGGLWFCETLDGEWRFSELSLREANHMLRRWVKARGGRAAQWPILVGAFIGRVIKWLTRGRNRG